ncbi:MAG: tRNA (guanosine(37)-N1)-methyltransferase TrmD [bacterium]|jgi:tRNA (guanine37-N1)-methyltransferase
MRIDIITIFTEMFNGPLTESILKLAQQKGCLDINLIDLRDYTTDRHRTVDDAPFGGGAGMVMKPEPFFAAVTAVRAEAAELGRSPRVLLMCPQGETFTQAKARELAQEEQLVFLCGHYEGIDERVREHLVTDELSIGDYVLTGGELPAMVIVDAVARLLPGVLGDARSAEQDSFSEYLLDYPHYTRPAVFRGLTVPNVLLSGNHELIRLWRRKEAIRRTYRRRPDLLAAAGLTEEDRCLLAEVKTESAGEADSGSAL